MSEEKKENMGNLTQLYFVTQEEMDMYNSGNYPSHMRILKHKISGNVMSESVADIAENGIKSYEGSFLILYPSARVWEVITPYTDWKDSERYGRI
jgi:hypothetical protein